MKILTNIGFILGAMILGLLYSYYFGGFPFIGLICIFAGLSLVMPSFFNFKISDFKEIFNYKKIVFLNVLINFIILPIVALSFGFFISDKGILAGIFLLSLLPGGGMIMQWIEKSGGNIKLGIKLFIINLIMLAPAMMFFYNFEALSLLLGITNIFSPETASLAQNCSNLTVDGLCNLNFEFNPKAFTPFIILVLIPFVVSRIILKFFPKTIVSFEKNKEKISLYSMSFIVFYLLGLSSSKAIFETSFSTLFFSFISCFIFYAILTAISFIVLRKNKNYLSLFWNISTRYITFGMALSTFFTGIYGASFILVFIFAYFLQILLSFILSSILKNKL